MIHCPKCSFEDETSEEVRIHALYTHQCYLPQCSTQLAKQDNLDYDAIRLSYAKLQKRIRINNDLLHYIPYTWKPTVSKIRASARQNGWKQTQIYVHVKKLPQYMRGDVVRRVKKENELRETMNNMNAFIKQEGIVI